MQANRGTAQLGGVVVCVKQERGKNALGWAMSSCGHVMYGRVMMAGFVANAHNPNVLVPRRCHIFHTA